MRRIFLSTFMACIIGAAMCGVGLGITFNYNVSHSSPEEHVVTSKNLITAIQK